MAQWVLSKGPDPAGVSKPQHGLAVREGGGGLLGIGHPTVSSSDYRLALMVEAPVAIWIEFAWAFNPKPWALISLVPTMLGGGDVGE